MAKAVSGKAAIGGSTLLEMLLVLAIIALAASIAGPSLMSRNRSEDLRTIGQTMASKLAVSRVRAIATARAVTVMLDPGARQVTFDRGKQLTLPDDVDFSVVTGRETVVAGRQAALVFLPDGSSTGMEITLKRGTETLRLKVHWLTGLVVERRWSP